MGWNLSPNSLIGPREPVPLPRSPSGRDYRLLLVRRAERLVHGNRKERLSLRDISSRLAEMGYITSQGTPFSAAQIKRLLEDRRPLPATNQTLFRLNGLVGFEDNI
jgi:hypothetical protein